MEKNNKNKKTPNKENVVLEDKPFWAEHYTSEEWAHRCWFERKGSEEDAHSAYVSDFSELDI